MSIGVGTAAEADNGHFTLTAASESGQRSLDRLVNRLTIQPVEARADFARVVLTELFLGHLAESVTAREEALRSVEANLWRWVAAVDHYAARLRALSDRPMADVRLLWPQGQTGDLMLRIDGEMIMVSSPRLSQQADFEARIVAQYCRQFSCPAGSPSGAPHAPVRPRRAAPVWQLSADGPSCRCAGGLALRFADMSAMRDKREACKQLMDDLDTLAGALARYSAQGLRIDWPELRVSTVGTADGHAVRLNRAGERVWLPLPSLARTPALFPEVLPWLAARARGVDYALEIADADAIIAPLLPN